LDKKTAEHEVARLGGVTSPHSAVSNQRTFSRWILISATAALLLLFLILTVMKDPLRVLGEKPSKQVSGGAAHAVPAGRGQAGADPETPALGPGAARLLPEELRLSIRHPDPERVPPVPVQGLADGEPPICWVPRDDYEHLVIDAGAERSWSHLLLFRCSLPSVAISTTQELAVRVSIPGQARSRLLLLGGEDAPTRVDLGGLMSDQLVLTLSPTRAAAGLSGIAGYHFKPKEP